MNQLRPLHEPLEVAAKTCAAIKPERNRRLLLLQGPVGPFFSELQCALQANGFLVRRILFNAGDRAFARCKDGCVRFTGTEIAWEEWLNAEISNNRPGAIILFGSSRPAHQIARRAAESHDISLISLEEGYLRSGYITCETGGNNQHSPMKNWKPNLSKDTPSSSGGQPVLGASFIRMSLWGILYYLARDMFSQRSDETLFHRKREPVLSLSGRWILHAIRRNLARVGDASTLRVLQNTPGYILVSLQVSSDSQITTAARGWTTDRLINAALKGVAAAGNDQQVVFKLHPLERDGQRIKRRILIKSKEFGIDVTQVKILHTGRMGDLAHYSGGMIVINSTSAFSGLHHEKPVLVLGDAIYRHVEIVTVGTTQEDVIAFFKSQNAKPPGLVNAFLSDLKKQSLLPGDFYASAGREAAVKGIVDRLEAFQTGPALQKDNIR